MVLGLHLSVLGLAVVRYVTPALGLGLVFLGFLSGVAAAFD